MDSIFKWLIKKGYEYTWNFKLGSKTPDLIAFKEGEIVAFEFKKWARNLSDAVGQCIFYLDRVNAAYVVLPLEEISKIQASYIKLLRNHGIGLIGINKKIKIFIRARTSSRDTGNIVEVLKERSFTRISSVLPYRGQNQEIKSKILQILKEHAEGLSILDISKLSHFHRHTITKYIHELIGAKIIYQRDLGTVKLHYLSKYFSGTPSRNAILKKRGG